MLAEESEGHFKCLIKNTEKCNFSVQIKKELENGKTITYKIKLLDSFKYIYQACYHVLLIIFLKGFIMINAQIISLEYI